MSDLEKILKSQKGKFIRVDFVLDSGEESSMQGILYDISGDYITLTGKAKIYLNRKIARIINFMVYESEEKGGS